MSEPVSARSFQDQHLDMMIRLAFLQEEQEAASQLLAEPDPALTSQDTALTERAFRRAFRMGRRRRGWAKAKRALPVALQIAACVLLLFNIAAPVAIASSAELRSHVLRLLMEIDQENQAAYFHFRQDPDASFFVPVNWKGDYYPSYIPEGFTTQVWDDGLTVELTGDNSQQIFFSQLGENAGVTVGIDGGTVETIQLDNGTTAYMISGNGVGGYNVSLTWMMEDYTCLDIMSYNLDLEETLRIANSLKKIIP